MPDVIFEKRAGKHDLMLVLKSGEWSSTDCPKQRPIPHDMFHYAVEHTLKKSGFLQRHSDIARTTASLTADEESEAVERLVETMQADSWSGRPDPEEVISLFLVTCDARGTRPFNLEPSDICAIRSCIDDLAARWEAVPVGGRLALEI